MTDCSYCHGNHERTDCPNVPTWRDEVIEECARAADQEAWKMGIGEEVQDIIAAIRALKGIEMPPTLCGLCGFTSSPNCIRGDCPMGNRWRVLGETGA